MVDNFVKTYQDVHDALVALQWTKDFTGLGIVKLSKSKKIIELAEKPDETQALRFKQRCGARAAIILSSFPLVISLPPLVLPLKLLHFFAQFLDLVNPLVIR